MLPRLILTLLIIGLAALASEIPTDGLRGVRIANGILAVVGVLTIILIWTRKG